MPYEITNPIARFWLEGDADDNDNVIAVADFFGEAGEQVRMTFTRPEESAALSEMLMECGSDLHEAKTHGIMSVVARKGLQDDDEELTVQEILDAKDNPIEDVE